MNGSDFPWFSTGTGDDAGGIIHFILTHFDHYHGFEIVQRSRSGIRC